MTLLCPPLLADTRYITDQLSLPLKEDPRGGSKTLRTLKAGTAVKYVVTDKETGYAMIKVGNTEGWVPERMLSKTPGAQQRLREREKQLQRLKKETAALKQQRSELSGDQKSQLATIADLEMQNRNLEEELTALKRATADVMAINNENQVLHRELDALKAEHNTVVEENRRLKDATAQQWFIRGAGVVIAGMVLGLILPRLRLKRRDDWSRGY